MGPDPNGTNSPEERDNVSRRFYMKLLAVGSVSGAGTAVGSAGADENGAVVANTAGYGGSGYGGGAYGGVSKEVSGPPPLPGEENQPSDLNGDGLYRDVDGDEEVDTFDVQALYENLDSDAVQENPEAFNFRGDDSEDVSIFDLQALFNDLRSDSN